MIGWVWTKTYHILTRITWHSTYRAWVPTVNISNEPGMSFNKATKASPKIVCSITLFYYLFKALTLDIKIWRMWANILLNTLLKGFRPSIKTPGDPDAVLHEKIYMFYRIEYWKLNLKFMSNVLSRGFKGVSAPWGGGSVPDCIWRKDICPRKSLYCCLPSQNAYLRLDFWCPVFQTPWPSTRPINLAEL